MQAIVTKYLNPTDTKGARIKATCDAGSVTVPFDYVGTEEQSHAEAAKALIRKLGWAGYGEWVAGSLPGQAGYSFVLVGKFPYVV